MGQWIQVWESAGLCTRAPCLHVQGPNGIMQVLVRFWCRVLWRMAIDSSTSNANEEPWSDARVSELPCTCQAAGGHTVLTPVLLSVG